MNTQQKPGQQINVELGEKEAEGIYSNLALISHSPGEFVLDFTRVLPGVPKTKVYARVVMTPQHAKSFLRALEENVARYEKQYGEIKVHSNQAQMQKQIGFRPANAGSNREDEDKK